MSEQRRFSRVPFDAQCTISAGGVERKAHLLDISLKGVLLELPRQWHPEAEGKVQVQVLLGDGPAMIRMDTHVSHREQDQLGLACDSIDLESISHLRRLIELNTGDPELIHRELAQLI